MKQLTRSLPVLSALFALTALKASASITFNAASFGSAGTATAATWSHTVGAGDNRMLVVGVSSERSTDQFATSVTYGAQALTLVPGSRAKSSATPYDTAELWYLPAPNVGTANIIVTYSTAVANGLQCGAVSLFGVKQDVLEAVAIADAQGSGGTYSLAITTLTDGAWLVDVVNNGTAGASFTTTTTGMAERWDSTSGGQLAQAGCTREVATAGTVTNTWTTGGTSRKAQSIAAFAPVPTVLNVFLTSPANHQVFLSDVTITATGTVSLGSSPYTVTFFTNSASGPYAQAGAAVATPPYQVSLGTLAQGTYHICATVADSLGASATSATNTFTVNADQAPAVALTGPALGTGFLPGEPIVIQATATDDAAVSRVEFYEGAALLGSDTSSPYSLTWNGTTAGAHSLTAKAVDSAGQTATSVAVSVTVASDTTNASLTFDGVDDCVTLGVASELGVKSFTLECWARVDGAGVTASSGSGGIAVYPLIDKGGSENDGSTVDCNYILGVQADYRLAADFEDMNSGLNHPIRGVTPLSTGVWHHCAVTYDNTTGWWRLYIDGVLDNSLQLTGAVNVLMPRHDSIQHFALGKATTSAGPAAGAFKGLIDEARVWNYARSAAEINTAKNLEITGATGLVGRFGMNEGTGTATGNSAGVTTGTLVNGPVWNTAGFPSATLRSAVETFDSYANGTLLTTLDGGNAWSPAGTPYTVVTGGGVNGTAGVSTDTSSQLFNWKGQPFQWSTLAAGTKVAISLDIQSNPAGTFDDDRVGWTVDASSQNTSANQCALQLDTVADGGMVVYWGGTKNVLNALSGIKISTWYRFNVAYTKLTAASAGIVGTLTELDATGIPTGTPYVGTLADSSTFVNPAPAARFTSTYQWPSFKNSYNAVGYADNASVSITAPGGGNQAPTVSISSPANSAAVRTNLTITATATDDVAISNVSFYADEALLGCDTSSPYSYFWNPAPMGSHALKAVAWDNSGLAATSAVVTVTVAAFKQQAQYVIVISVDGLGGTYLGKIFDGSATGGPYPVPNFMRLKNEGASTLAAHCDNDNWETLPNHTSLMTARPQVGTAGHNWTLNSDPSVGQTVHSVKGAYVASVFDVAHDNGLPTGLYANKSKFSLFHTYGSYTGGGSYDATYGAADVILPDNGSNKVDHTYINTALGGIVVNTFIAQQQSASSNCYAFLHINETDYYGHNGGWGSATWNRSVVTVDGMLGKIFKLIEQDAPAMAGHTTVILTADHGNQDDPPTGADRYSVPFFVWGPGVSAGTDLYALNAGRHKVASSYPMAAYSGTQPIRNAEANNLALGMLGLEAIPGSTFDSAQDLAVTCGTLILLK